MENSRIKKYRVVNRRRFVSFLVIVLVIMLLVIMVTTRGGRAYSTIYEIPYEEIIVKKGDTLWNIAIKHMPTDYDVRKMVFKIMKFNNLIDPSIYPGDLIKVPLKYKL